MMRIVLIHRYFWPDTPLYAHMLKDIALNLGRAGHDVQVLTCQPSYNRSVVRRALARERLAERVAVRRWPVLPDRRFAALKLVNLVLFCVRLVLARRRIGPVDVVMAATTPPVAVARVASWFARLCRARFIYHKQDIYPEVMLASGALRAGPMASLLRRVDVGTTRAADRVVVLSEDMTETERARGLLPSRITVINNFDPWPADGLERTTDRIGQDRPAGHEQFHVVFAGNLGRLHNLETIVDVATRLRLDRRLAFHFFGHGALRPYLDREVARRGLGNVHVHGYRSQQELADFLRSKADIGIVSLLPGVIRALYPSRTLSYLRRGCPVLALVEKDSELARTIVSAGAGVQADPDNPDQIVGTLQSMAAEPQRLAGARARARALYTECCSAEKTLARWVDLFEELQENAACDPLPR